MNNFKSIGGVGGIFHILVPGLFLLMNIVAGAYYSPFVDSQFQSQIKNLLVNPTASLLLAISFGYLIGVILRLFRCESPDLFSAWFLRKFYKEAKGPQSDSNLFAYDTFPYTKWLGNRCKLLPDDVQTFHNAVWDRKNSSAFLNYCKVMIISEDERAGNEIYAAEALSRYISGMLYALFIALGIIIAVAMLQLFKNAYDESCPVCDDYRL